LSDIILTSGADLSLPRFFYGDVEKVDFVFIIERFLRQIKQKTQEILCVLMSFL